MEPDVRQDVARSLIVSGAGGWIGARLLRQAAARGVPARAVGRALLLADRAPLPAADGAVAIHLAAIAHRTAGATEYDRINRALAVSFAQRARAAGAARFVFVSTAAVMPAGSPRPWTEADAPLPGDDYARAKLAAERQLLALHEPDRFEVTVLRPPLVYGPGARANFRLLLRLAASGWPLPLAAARAPRSMVFLDNLVDALLHVSNTAAAAGRTFFVADGTERTVADWIGAVRAAQGRPPRLFGVPAPLLRLAARAASRQAAYERLFLPLRVDGSALRATGWQPPVDVDAALLRTLDAWRGADA